jgi:hypothetical protein
VLFFSGSFIEGSHVCIVLVLLNVPAYVCVPVHVIRGISSLLFISYWPGTIRGGLSSLESCRSMMGSNCSSEVAQEMTVICSCKKSLEAINKTW